jgi:hypothetical protein
MHTCSMRTIGPSFTRKQEPRPRTHTDGLLSVHLSCRLAQARTGETRASPSGASGAVPPDGPIVLTRNGVMGRERISGVSQCEITPFRSPEIFFTTECLLKHASQGTLNAEQPPTAQTRSKNVFRPPPPKRGGGFFQPAAGAFLGINDA